MKGRDTCLCKRYEKVQLMADKLHHLGAVKAQNAEDLLEDVAAVLAERNACIVNVKHASTNKYTSRKHLYCKTPAR